MTGSSDITISQRAFKQALGLNIRVHDADLVKSAIWPPATLNINYSP